MNDSLLQLDRPPCYESPSRHGAAGSLELLWLSKVRAFDDCLSFREEMLAIPLLFSQSNAGRIPVFIPVLDRRGMSVWRRAGVRMDREP
jgi:hypothetical protein